MGVTSFPRTQLQGTIYLSSTQSQLYPAIRREKKERNMDRNQGMAGQLSVDLDELRLEDQSRVGGDDATDGPVSVGQIGSDGQLALLADLHAEEALVPALDDLAGADLETKGLLAVVARVELLAVGEGALVVDLDAVACF